MDQAHRLSVVVQVHIVKGKQVLTRESTDAGHAGKVCGWLWVAHKQFMALSTVKTPLELRVLRRELMFIHTVQQFLDALTL